MQKALRENSELKIKKIEIPVQPIEKEPEGIFGILSRMIGNLNISIWF